MGLHPVTRSSMSDQVIAQMKENIEKGIWKPEERLPGELQLCEIFGTSRVTVRNALQKLAGEGLIETRVGDGSYDVAVVGSFGCACREDLVRIGKEYGVRFAEFIKSPVEVLVKEW